MSTQIIKTNKRYLSEVFTEIPQGIINKKLADVGGTYLAVNCDYNYIIVCPTRDLVDSIFIDENNKYEVYPCYGGSKQKSFDKYCESNSIKKIAVTYDSFPKLTSWISDLSEYRVLVDEYHLLLQNIGFREDAINELFNVINKYNYVTYLTATPFDCKYEITPLKGLDRYEIEWEREVKIKTVRVKSPSPIKALVKFISNFIKGDFVAPNIHGEVTKVEELYIFLNSVNSIKQVCDTLDLDNEEIKICCANRVRNRKIMDKYSISSVTAPNKKINFFTSKCFQGCNLFTNNGLVIVVSDANRDSLVTDLTSDLVQIAGRLRDNNNYHNCFRNLLIHIYSTKSNILEDDEFEEIMNNKIKEAKVLISGNSKLSDEESKVLIERLNLTNDVVTVKNDRLVYSELKEQYFRYWQELRKCYKDGISISQSYDKRFTISNQAYIDKFEFELSKAVTVSYQQLIKDYYESFDPSYEADYPEFKEYKQFLTLDNLNTLRFNKTKALEAIKKKKELIIKMNKLELERFYSRSYLKEILGTRASVIEEFFDYEESRKGTNRGYILKRRKIFIHP